MSASGVELTRRSSRAVWAWCVSYTVLAPAAWRERRREELRSHLWEAEQAGQSSRRVMKAAWAGIAADLTWALARGLPALGRSFGTTTPYLVIAAAFPIQFYLVSLFDEDGALARTLLPIGAVGGVVTLLVGVGVAIIRRHRERPRDRWPIFQ